MYGNKRLDDDDEYGHDLDDLEADDTINHSLPPPKSPSQRSSHKRHGSHKPASAMALCSVRRPRKLPMVAPETAGGAAAEGPAAAPPARRYLKVMCESCSSLLVEIDGLKLMRFPTRV